VWETLGQIAESIAYAVSVLGIVGVSWRVGIWIFEKLKGQ